MNARIKLLAEQAYDELVEETGNIVVFDEDFQQRFAQLIVQECIATVKKRYMGDNNREDMEVRRCVADIQTHFGVEP